MWFIHCHRSEVKIICYVVSWPEICDIEPIFCQRLTALKLKMVAKRLSTRMTDYVQLDNFSSVVLYDNLAPRKKKGKIFEVERIITRKKINHVSITGETSPIYNLKLLTFCLNQYLVYFPVTEII